MDRTERKSLIDSHLGKVALIAKMLARRLPPWVDWQELAQEGVIAMIEAAPSFDPEKGEFWPFVYRPVRGAMLDWLGRNCRDTCHVELSAVRLSAPDQSEGMARELDLDRALQKLTVQERRVIRATRDGHEPVRIAGMLNITPRHARRLLDKGARRMRRQLVA